ncbi:MAG: DUF2378 family protein [Myxococcaceae bacterium]
MTDSFVVFEQTIEGLFVRGLAGKLTPGVHQRLKALGIDLSHKLLPAYPFHTWMKALELAAAEVFHGEPTDKAMFKLGELFIDGYQHTQLGRALLEMIKVLGPRRALQRSTANFRAGNNFTETRLTDLTPTSNELWMNEVGPYPAFTAGTLSAVTRASGARDVKVEVAAYDGHSATYRVSWR